MTDTTPPATVTETETETETAEETTAIRRPLRPRADVIVWGALLLVGAALGITTSFVDLRLTPAVTIVWTIVAVGGLLVCAGIIGAIARGVSGRAGT